MRTRFALSAGRTAVRLSRALGRDRGTSIGGEVALRIDPQSLSRLAIGRQIVLVTGTNGKSTTTRMLADAVRNLGSVAHNGTGASMRNGIVGVLDGERDAPYAVLELDEIHLGPVATATRPAVIVLLNLSREYTGEVSLATTLAHWRETLSAIDWPCTVVANVDDPLVRWAAQDAPGLVPVSAGLLWTADAVLCRTCHGQLQWDGPHWFCEGCGLDRPEPLWHVDGDKVHGPHGTAILDLAIDGRSVANNALLAIAAAAQLGVGPHESARAVSRVRAVDGRYAPFRLGEQGVRLFMVQNPAGWREMVDLAGSRSAPMVFAMDAFGMNDATVLWDAPAELLSGTTITVTGQRRYDLAAWLDTCGAQVRVGPADPIEAISELPNGDVYVATNSSAFDSLRRRLTE